MTDFSRNTSRVKTTYNSPEQNLLKIPYHLLVKGRIAIFQAYH